MAPLTWPEIRPRIIHARAANAIGAASKRSAAAGTVRVASMPGMVRHGGVYFHAYQSTLDRIGGEGPPKHETPAKRGVFLCYSVKCPLIPEKVDKAPGQAGNVAHRDATDAMPT